MEPVALGLVLASAAVHAAWNAVLKREADPEAAGAWIVGGAAAISAALSLASAEGLPTAASLPWVAASAGVEAAYFVTLTRALTALPLGTAYGVSRGGGQLVTWPVSMVWQGEVAGPWTLGAAGLLVAGLLARVTRPLAGPGLGWALACALAIGLYPLTYKQALATGAPPFALFALSLGGALPAQLAALGGARTARLAGAARGRAGRLSLAAAACAASFLLFLLALDRAGAGRASAMRNTSIVFATVLGRLQGEVLDGRAALAALAITLGAIGLAG